MARLTDVAKAAGVSLTTASQVLNNREREHRVSAAAAERVRAAAKQLGYVANYHARSMRMGRAEVLGVALDSYSPGVEPASCWTNPYFSSILAGVETRLHTIGYRTMVITSDASHRAPDRGLIELQQRRVDGLIVLGATVRTYETDFLTRPPQPNVVVIESPAPTHYPTVEFDEEEGVRLILRHLAELGHRRVLWLSPDEKSDSRRHYALREQFFIRAAWDVGVQGISQRYPLDDPARGTFGSPAERARQSRAAAFMACTERGLAECLTRTRDFTAVACYNDEVAMAAAACLARSGLRVPEDVSVVGFDNVRADVWRPALTTVDHRFEAMGTKAADLALEMIQTPETVERLRGTRHVIAPQLLVRDSTGPAPAI